MRRSISLPRSTTSENDSDQETITPTSTFSTIDLEADEKKQQKDEPYTIFTRRQKRCIVFMAAVAAFFSPFTVFIYLPAMDYLSTDLAVSLELINVTITVYLVVQGVVPALLGMLADQMGHRPVYITSLLIFCAGSVGLALQQSYPLLVVLRMVQSAGSSGLTALGVVVVTDIAPPQARGRYMAAMLTGTYLGPNLGPFIGGVVADKVGWNCTFWVLAISSAVFVILFAVFFPETCRNVVGNGSRPVGPLNKPIISRLTSKDGGSDKSVDFRKPKLRAVTNPFRGLRNIFRRQDALVLGANALIYINFTCIQDSLAHLAMQHYQLNGLQAGLCYIPYGIATLVASYAVGKIIDRDYRITAKAHGIDINDFVGDDLTKFPIEKARLRSVWYFILVAIASIIGYGWAIQHELHLGVAMAMQFLCCLASTGVCTICLTLYMDMHPLEPGMASVAVNLTRCLAAAVGTAVVELCLEWVGGGWTFTLYGLLGCFSVPMLLAVRMFKQK